jgi:uncharacterized repeat protein (TIGR03803 family)
MTRSSIPFQPFSLPLFTFALLLASATFTAAQTETILHTFPTGSSDGYDTSSGLIADGAGALYGVTHTGGPACSQNALGCGVAFKLTPLTGGGWSESVLHSFTGLANDGAFPQGNLLFDSAAHIFYGITGSGGTRNSGTAFFLKPGSPWTETIIYNSPRSQNPQEGVVLHGGMLYGIAAGGSFGTGLVYRLRPPTTGTMWQQQILYTFTNGADGAFPQAAPIVDSAGNVYGTTIAGPGGIGGTVYKLSPPAGGVGAWTYTNLYTFSGNADGDSPHSGVVFDSAGNLYGTTETGGASNVGVVYQLTPPAGGSGPWTETVLYSFTGATDGGLPWAGVTLDSSGNVLGATTAGGDLSCGNGGGCGLVFKLSPPSGSGPWTETVLYSFAGGADGEEPFYTPLLLNGNLFGTTGAGGGSKNGGIAYEVTP